VCGAAIALSADAATPRRILLIGGPPDGHRPVTHEYAKSVLLLRDHLAGLPGAAAGRFVVETSENGWPEDPADGGRGFGFTGGHFFAHWENDSFRGLMTNAILWAAGAEVRDAGSAAFDRSSH
jgi:hypothetical protein